MKHLACDARLPLEIRTRLLARASEVAIPPGRLRQPRAPAADESRPFGNGQTHVEWPRGNRFPRPANSCDRGRARMGQRVGDDGFEQTAGREERDAEAALV